MIAGRRGGLPGSRRLAEEDIDGVVVPVHRPTRLNHDGCPIRKIVGLNLLAALQRPGFLGALEGEDLVLGGVNSYLFLVDQSQRAAHGDKGRDAIGSAIVRSNSAAYRARVTIGDAILRKRQSGYD